MTISDWIFSVFPYAAAAIMVIFSFMRWKYEGFTVSSLSSQFLEGRALFWGSVSWHYAILAVFVWHLLPLFAPAAVLRWNSAPARLFSSEILALGAGILTVFGIAVLCARRLASARIRAVTSRTDVVILLLLLLQAVTGVATAVLYRWGSGWFAATLTPYLWSLARLSPESRRLAMLPLLVKAHIAGAFTILALLPFSRLIHILVFPLPYLWRPAQLVIWRKSPGPQ